jgi:hypothetical protein
MKRSIFFTQNSSVSHLQATLRKHLQLAIFASLAIGFVLVGCVPKPGAHTTTPPNPGGLTEAIETCNHPKFVDTLVTYSCTELMSCPSNTASPKSPSQKNSVRFRVGSDCSDGNGNPANYNFHNVPVRYGIYKLQASTGNQLHFRRMKTFTCMLTQMEIASDQFLDLTRYMITMEENPNILPTMDIYVPNGSFAPGWVFKTGKFRGKPCGIQ